MIAPLAVLWSFVVAQAIVAESALSFLGVGLPPPTPSWGSMLAEAVYLSTAWWIAVMPGVALLILIAAINLAGVWLSGRLDSRALQAVSLAEPSLRAVAGLSVSFVREGRATRVVDDATWSVREEETVVILGESGSGKSVSALAVAGLLTPNARVAGSVQFAGTS